MEGLTSIADAEPTVKPWSRLAILIGFLALAFILSNYLTGSIVPSDPNQALIFQGGLLLIVLGSAILEHKFTKPADSAVNSLIGIITLIPVHSLKPSPIWWLVFSYCSLVFLLSSICIAASTGKRMSAWRQTVARTTYRPAVLLGKARVLYSVLFLFGLLSFYELQSKATLLLILFWGAFIVIWPLGLPEFLSSLRSSRAKATPIGKILRTDAPNIIRVALEATADWSPSHGKVYQQADGQQMLVIPLYHQVQDETVLGTGLCAKTISERLTGLTSGELYDLGEAYQFSESEISEKLSGDASSKLIGFIVEDSSIGEIRFETLDSSSCREGLVVWCLVRNERIFYQITNGLTREETLQADRHGFQIAIASQLGRLDSEKGFSKCDWIPAMNTPIFSVGEKFGSHLRLGQDGDFCFGLIPGTEIKVVGPLIEFMDFHTAILGVTGSGKTELAFDIVQKAAESGVKVVCIDLTAQYDQRLSHLTPVNLSITAKLADELGKKLFEVETGEYGAGKEKKALKPFADMLRADISASIKQFLTDKSDKTRVGLIQLQEISNTQATLYITELYLTCLLHFARDNGGTCPRVLIVVEEAHTVMPEPMTMGVSDKESRGLVAKIAQIALQGRKYGVGLLVIAQRTATVSKSVLTQCNTVISFTCFDDTSLGFLANVFGKTHTDLIPNLPALHAVVLGKGVRSEMPIAFRIPFSEEKAKLALNRTKSATAGAAEEPAVRPLPAPDPQ
jgi:hypothetical protein